MNKILIGLFIFLISTLIASAKPYYITSYGKCAGPYPSIRIDTFSDNGTPNDKSDDFWVESSGIDCNGDYWNSKPPSTKKIDTENNSNQLSVSQDSDSLIRTDRTADGIGVYVSTFEEQTLTLNKENLMLSTTSESDTSGGSEEGMRVLLKDFAKKHSKELDENFKKWYETKGKIVFENLEDKVKSNIETEKELKTDEATLRKQLEEIKKNDIETVNK
jgi:type 1 fimbria pilin